VAAVTGSSPGPSRKEGRKTAVRPAVGGRQRNSTGPHRGDVPPVHTLGERVFRPQAGRRTGLFFISGERSTNAERENWYGAKLQGPVHVGAHWMPGLMLHRNNQLTSWSAVVRRATGVGFGQRVSLGDVQAFNPSIRRPALPAAEPPGGIGMGNMLQFGRRLRGARTSRVLDADAQGSRSVPTRFARRTAQAGSRRVRARLVQLQAREQNRLIKDLSARGGAGRRSRLSPTRSGEDTDGQTC